MPAHRSLAHAALPDHRVVEEQAHPDAAFGSFTTAEGTVRHVGRRHVEDAEGRVVLLDWRSADAEPFYLAAAGSPRVVARTHVVIEGDGIVRVVDEPLDGSAAGVARQLAVEASARPRTARLRAAAATLQADQFELVRAPGRGTLVVAGVAGTGKTAIGLHRAAWLAHRDDDARAGGVLYVAATPACARAASGLLAELDASPVRADAVMTMGRVRATRLDPAAVRRVKGDVRMAAVVERGLRNRVRAPHEPTTIEAFGVRVTLDAGDVRPVIQAARAATTTFDDARERFRDLLASMVAERVATGFGRLRVQNDPGQIERTVRGLDAFRTLADRIWPSVSATGLVELLLEHPPLLRAAAKGTTLTPHELALLRREGGGDASWTMDDLALIDEAEALISGPPPSYAHVVVDDAQDLSPMQLRMAGRRSARGSMTVLADPLRGASTWGPRAVDDICRDLGAPAPVASHSVTTAWRFAPRVAELVSRVGAPSAPGPVRSIAAAVAPAKDEPLCLRAVAPEAIHSATSGVVRRAIERHGFVLVVTSHPARIREALDSDGIEASAPGQAGPDTRVVVTSPVAIPGAEADAVVMVEPADLIRHFGDDALYLTLGRAARQVVVVHARALPRALALHVASAAKRTPKPGSPRKGASRRAPVTPGWARNPPVTGGPLYASEWYPGWWTGG